MAKKELYKLKAAYDVLFEKRLKRFYDVVICISSGLKRQLELEKAVVLNGGAESSRLIDYSKEESRSTLGIGQDEFIIGMSNVTPEDSRENYSFFKSLALLSDAKMAFRVLMTGPSEDYIRELEADYNLAGPDNLSWLGFF